jgi:hypothetical protein
VLEDWELDALRVVIDDLEAEQERTYDQVYCIQNPKARAEGARKWAKKNPELTYASSFRNALKKYGLTASMYDEMMKTQGSVCAICKEGCPTMRRLSVDHCHATGRIRGLLCNACNLGIGKFKDDADLMRSAINYLLKDDD